MNNTDQNNNGEIPQFNTPSPEDFAASVTPPHDLWFNGPPVTIGLAEYPAESFVSKHTYSEGGLISGDRPDSEVEEQLAFAKGKRVFMLTARVGQQGIRVNSDPVTPEERMDTVMTMFAQLGRQMAERYSAPKSFEMPTAEEFKSAIIAP